MARKSASAVASAVLVLLSKGALAQTSAPGSVPAPEALETGWVQFGASVNGEVLAGTGKTCPEGARVPCIFGSGGGLTIRVGYRFHDPLYLGGAYEFTKLDSNNLLRLGILQQARFEMRYMIDSPSLHSPYLTAGVGVAGYGNEWGVSTVAGTAFVGLGIEAQLSRTSLFTAALVYRPLIVRGWTDVAGQTRETGFVSFVGFEFGLEQRNPISY